LSVSTVPGISWSQARVDVRADPALVDVGRGVGDAVLHDAGEGDADPAGPAEEFHDLRRPP
jgi:hypothetical protein